MPIFVSVALPLKSSGAVFMENFCMKEHLSSYKACLKTNFPKIALFCSTALFEMD